MFEWIVSVIEAGGYAGIFFLMVLENIFPPIPSELIIPLAGFSAAQNGLSLPGVIVVATLGAVVGSLPWYMLGRGFGLRRIKALSARYGRLLTVSPSEIDAAEVWFLRRGHFAVLFGRLVPTVRTLISVPAGVARMPFNTFLLYSTIGSAIWTSTLAIAGYLLESQYESVAGYVGVLSDAVVVGIVLIYIYRVVTFRKEA